MKTPGFFISTALLFWGWQTQTVWIAICLAALLESSRLTKTRFDMAPSDFNKFVDISTMLLAGTVVLALTIDIQHASKIILKWIPLILFPIMAAQQYSTAGRMDIRSFFLKTRKLMTQDKNKQPFYEPRTINVSYIYTCVIFFSAASANINDASFFASVVLFSTWALWRNRPKRFSIILWSACILIMIISGYATHHKIKDVGIKITHWAMERYTGFYAANPFKTHTAMGDIGQLKLSNKIVLRILYTDRTPIEPILLHQATYNKFAASTWFTKSEFKAISSESDKTKWQINSPITSSAAFKKITIYARPIKSKSVLCLPPGVVLIDQLKAEKCEKNAFQTVRVSDVAPLIKSHVSYTNALNFDTLPDKTDLFISKKERAGIEKFIESLEFYGKSDQEILVRIKQEFLNRFTYSLDLQGKGRQKNPIENFLHHTRSGHCELFATATVLILRNAGIPARYATGFIAHEISKISGQLVVRHRDAHAWVKVFINGEWINFDTTPPTFLQVDSQMTTNSWIGDLMSFLGFKFSQLRHETGKKLLEQYGVWLILPLGLILFFRLRQKGHIKQIRSQEDTAKDKTLEHRPHNFLKLEKILFQSGFTRHPFESLISWQSRIEYHLKPAPLKDTFQRIIFLYNRLKFSQTGLTALERLELDKKIKNFIDTYHLKLS